MATHELPITLGKKTDGAKGAAAASRQPQQQPAKSKGKKQKKQTLSEFLGGNTGTTGSWADDDEDEFMHQPERPTETAQSAGDWRGGGPARQEPGRVLCSLIIHTIRA